MKRIGIIVVLGLFLGFAPTLHAVSTCSPNIPESTPAAEFTDHGDGTVTHSRTGLMWKRCAEGQTWSGGICTGIASTATWANALKSAVSATTAGHSDWRLPNIKELESIVEEKCVSPSINEAIFPGTPASYFWSASAYASYSYDAWLVTFSNGYAGSLNKSYAYQVRLVRSGQSFGSFDSSKNGVVLSATALSFAAQNLGTTSAAQTVTLINNGGTPLNIAGIAASGDYAVAHNCGAGLGAGGFCTLDITFTPTATGTRTGAVTLTDDSIFSPRTISLSGTGQGAVVSLSATSLYFASQNQGTTSAAQTITLTNTGVAALNISSIVASGEFARTTTCGATLAMGANCTISVTFRPTATGARSGSLVITSNANSSPDTISLNGTGLAAPVVSLNPASLTFAAENVGTSSAPKTIALTNTGGVALTLTSISASGDFAVTHNCGGGLGAGGFCNLSVIFTPTLAGSRTGAITVTSNAAGSPHSASLSGGLLKLNQTIGAISFSPATLAVAGNTTVSATATSGLAVTYSSAAAGICTVSGSTVTAIAAGTCTIAADQAGDASYNAAAQVTQSLTITSTPLSISPSSASANAAGLAGNISVTIDIGSAWTATSNASWLTVTSGSSGNGNGSVVYSVATNTNTAARTGTLTIGGEIFTVTQAGASSSAPCSSTTDTDGDGISDCVETTEGTNPDVKDNDIFSNNRLFVMQQYRDFLSREGESGGLSFWIDAVNGGSTSKAQLIESFFSSAEFQGTVAPVARLYFAYFLRIPDYAGLQYWIAQYRAGVSLAAISESFAASAEFINRYGTLDNGQFVDLVYSNVLGRPADSGGRASWLAQLDSGALTKGQVMLGFSESAEYQSNSYNRTYVTMMYVGMLRRSPEQGGFDAWVSSMGSGLSGQNLIDGFIESQEYRGRFM